MFWILLIYKGAKKMDLSSGGQVPCSTGFLLLGECSRNPSVSVYQLVLLWEPAFSLVNVFADFQCVCPFHNGWFTSISAHTALSVQQFLTQNGMTPVPHPPYSPNLAPSKFLCFPGWKKPSKGNVLLMWKRWDKLQKHYKASKSMSSKPVLSSGKKCLDRYIVSHGESF